MPTRRFECINDLSNKFWQVTWLDAASESVLVRWGKNTWSHGTTNRVDFNTAAERVRFVDAKVREKLRKGYRETGAGPDLSGMRAPDSSTITTKSSKRPASISKLAKLPATNRPRRSIIRD